MRYLIMRYPMTAICLVLSVLITGSARAEEEVPNNEDRAGRRAEMRQKMLAEFDADGDGELSDAERTTAREAMRSRRGGDAKGGSAKGAKVAKQAGKGRRGPGGRPDPAQLFDEYDVNGDGQLSREEFMKLSEAMRPPRPPRGADQRGGARPDGPPQEGRRRFDRDSPLKNPDDRPGPPPRSEGRRRFRDDDGGRGQAGGPGARGPGGEGPGRGGLGRGGPGGEGPPNPARIFEHFDENGDDQLSREEFMKLADRMREMRQRGGPGGERGFGPDRGPRGGPPREEGPSSRRRPPRPESDGADSPDASEDKKPVSDDVSV